MEKIQANLTGRKNVYVHNDLENAAYHFKTAIEEKLVAGNRVGIAFDYMACLIMLVFTFEAKINFLGHKKVPNWKERRGFDKKVKKVFAHLNVDPDWTTRPYSTIEQLKKFRTSIAHGKPLEIEYDKTVEIPADEIDRQIDLKSDWEAFCAHDEVFNAYDDVDAIWKELLAKSDLTVFETTNHGSSSLTFVEKVIDA